MDNLTSSSSQGPGAGPRSSARSLLLGSKLTWIAVLYLAQGFPAGLVNNTMPVAFSKAGVDLKAIGLLALAGIPWTFKFLWAPLIDRIGGRRRWITGCLSGMAVLTALFGTSFAGEATPLIWTVIVGIAFLSATQDIAIDAYSIELLDRKELGYGNGVRVTAYRIALILAGGALVAMAGSSGWSQAWWVAAGGLLVLAILTPLAPAVDRPASTDGRPLFEVASDIGWAIGMPLFAAALLYWIGGQLQWDDKVRTPLAVVFGLAASTALAFRAGDRAAAANGGGEQPLAAFLAKPGAWGLLVFALLFKLGDQAMAPMTTPFLDRGAGFSESEIGLLRSTFGMFAAITGALIGGFLTSRWGIFRALWILGLFQAVSNLGYTYAAWHPTGRVVWTAGLLEDLCGGLGTAPFLALLMSACDRRHAATQYAFLSAVYSLCRNIAGTFSGYLATDLGFGPYFALTFVLALPAFALLPLIRPFLDADAKPASESAAQNTSSAEG